jgi:hypothetical protein
MPWQLSGNGRSGWSTKLIRGLKAEAAAGFQSRRELCREPTPVTPQYAAFPTYKAADVCFWHLADMPYLVHPLSSSERMDMNSLASLDFGSTRSNPSINLKYSGPSLSISASACLVSVSAVLVSVFC